MLRRTFVCSQCVVGEGCIEWEGAVGAGILFKVEFIRTGVEQGRHKERLLAERRLGTWDSKNGPGVAATTRFRVECFSRLQYQIELC